MFGKDRARDTRRQPNLPSNPRPATKGGPEGLHSQSKPPAQRVEKRDIGYEPYTKNLYSSNEPTKKAPKDFHYGSGFGQADWSNQKPGRTGIDAI
jgi:hypothetical protein